MNCHKNSRGALFGKQRTPGNERLPLDYVIRVLYFASTIIKNRKFPPTFTPSRNCRSIVAAGASGADNVTVPAARVEFRPPPMPCAGGVSSVVP
jgi:hypothetical protein